ncbi:retrovirus-related pol polyprotein from transposon TNT 1-94 [Tanacetum coccineum]
MTVCWARDTVGSHVVQQNGIRCFNCKGFGHYAKECRKPKRVKDYTYHKEKMMMCKQAEQGVPLQAEQADWLEDTDEEIDEHELEAHYQFMAKIHHCFVHELKKEMNDDLEYVKSLENEIEKLESEKADFSNIYDLLLEEYVSKDVTCSYLHSLSDLNSNTELQCLYLHKVKECECLAQKLSKQTESVNKEVHNNLLKSFSKLEKHSISLELALQQCKEQEKNNSVCKENGSNVFRKEREQYHEIQDLKAQMQDKNIAISELKKLIENCKGKSVETQFNKPSVVRQPNAQRIPKPSVLGKPTPFSNSPKMRSFQTKQSVNKTNVSDGLFKQATQQNSPQIRKQAVRNTNVIAPGPSWNCPKHVSQQSPREKVGSNDMVHNYYLEKAKKSAQLQKDKEVNGKPSMIDPARLPNTANGCKPKPRNWQASMSSRVSNKDVHLGDSVTACWSNGSVDLNVSVAMYGYVFICVCVGYMRLDNQSIKSDRLIGIGFVLNFVKFISFTFGDKEMISVIEAVSR